MNVWNKLPKPFFALAPMDDVTDTVFRRLIAQCAKPDVMFTEFASVDGLQSSGRVAVIKKLKFTSEEQPLIAQVWGMKPENYRKSARELVKMGFNGIDINMGCPVKKVVKLGACSALINNQTLAGDIIQAVQDGAGGDIPISVKTRTGFDKVDFGWIEFLLSNKLDSLIVHGRTSKQLSKVPNDWALIGKISQMRDEIAPDTVIVGNGDVLSRQQGLELAKQHNLDGIMIGRGIFKDPYVFSESSAWPKMDRAAKLELYRKHIRYFDEEWGKNKNPAGLKKFAKVYINGFDGAGEMRTQIMECSNADQLLAVLKQAQLLEK